VNPSRTSTRPPARPFRRFAFVGGVLLLGATLALAGGPGLNLLLATFTGVADGPGDGVSFPADNGRVLTWTASGKPFPQVAPNSGILNEKLVLTDYGGDTQQDFGIICRPTQRSWTGVNVGFDMRLLSKGTSFSITVVDVSGIDISRMTVKGDGSLDVDGKQIKSGGVPNIDYRVNLFLTPGTSGPDKWLVIITKVGDGSVLGTWNGLLPTGYRAPDAVGFVKTGGAPGALVLDNLQVDSLK